MHPPSYDATGEGYDLELVRDWVPELLPAAKDTGQSQVLPPQLLAVMENRLPKELILKIFRYIIARDFSRLSVDDYPYLKDLALVMVGAKLQDLFEDGLLRESTFELHVSGDWDVDRLQLSDCSIRKLKVCFAYWIYKAVLWEEYIQLTISIRQQFKELRQMYLNSRIMLYVSASEGQESKKVSGTNFQITITNCTEQGIREAFEESHRQRGDDHDDNCRIFRRIRLALEGTY